MSPSLGRYPTRRPRGRIRKVGRRQRPTCASAIRAGGVNPVVSNLRLQKTPSADSSLQHGSTGIDRVSPYCADGLRKYWPKCATVHRGSLQALVARPEAHGVDWAYLGAEVQGPADHLPLQWLSLANAASGLGWPLHARRVALGVAHWDGGAAISGRRS